VEYPSRHTAIIARSTISRVTQQPEQVTQQRTIAGRYAMLDELGRGGMGIVWLAEDRTIGRRVAIKELHLPAGVPPAERKVLEERVLREARTAGRLNDPGVVTVYDVVQEAGATYIVMELIQAPTLAAIVANQGPLPQDAVSRIAEQLLSALEAAHAAGVVHRDVKPSNIMVAPNGRVKLTDFGIAQSVDDPRLTTSGVLIGSPTYLAPELIHGAQADAGSDLWALAASLFFAVEGHSAFERSSTAATMHAIINEVPYLTRCRGPLASVIMGLLNPTPQARLSAQQVRGLLAQGHPSTGEQTIISAGQVAGGTAMYPAPGATQVAARPPARRSPWPVVALVALLVAGAFAGGWFGGRAGLVDPPAVDQAKGETFTYGDGGQIPVFTFSPHNCGGSPIESGREYTSSVNCEETHDFEVAYGLDLYGSDAIDYPGVDRLTAYGEKLCALVFTNESFVPTDRRDALSYVTLVPSDASWNAKEDYDRAVYCLLRNRDQSQLGDQVVPTN
jgi:hypothetical protein